MSLHSRTVLRDLGAVLHVPGVDGTRLPAAMLAVRRGLRCGPPPGYCGGVIGARADPVPEVPA